MKINYHNKKFRILENSENGETSSEVVFEYKQINNILTSEYHGGRIVSGHLLGLVDINGNIEMSYHQINSKNEIKTGQCFSKPELMKNGKIKIYESWEWSDGEKGKTVLIEI